MLLHAALPRPAAAANYTWSGATNALWTNTGNWSPVPGAAPGSADTTVFDGAGSGNRTIDVGTGQSTLGVLFSSTTAAAYTIGSGAVNAQSLTLATTGTIAVDSTVVTDQLFNAAVLLGDATSGTYTFQNNDLSNLLTFSGSVVGGTGGTAGAKTLTVAGSGSTTISGNISNGGATSLILSKSGAGTLTLSGTNAYTGATTVSGGVLRIASGGALTAAGNINSISGGRLSIVGSVTMGANTYFAVGSGVASTTGTTTIDGGLLAVGNSAFLIGGGRGDAGSPGAGTFTVNSGTVTVAASSGNQGGSDANNIWINPYGNGGASSLVLNGGVFQTARPISDGGAGGSSVVFNGGTLRAAAGIDLLPNTVLTAVVNSGGAVIDSGAFSASIGRALTAGTPSGGLTKVGSGTLTLSAANTYSGTTRISAGVLSITNASGMQNSTLDMNALDSGTATFGQNSTLGGLTGSRNLDMGTRTLSVGNNSQNTTFSGTLSNGGLTKVGNGTLTLTGSNSYSLGTMVNAGVLAVSTTASLPSWNVANGLTVNLGAAVAVGNSVADADVATMISTGSNFRSGASIGFDTNAGDRTYSPAIGNTSQGSLGLVKVGANTLTLTGANTYTGATSVTGGRLLIGSAGSIASAGSMNTTGGGLLSISGSVTMAGNTYFAVGSGVASTTGTTTIDGGLLAVGTSAFLIGGGRGDATTSIGMGVFAVNSGTVTVAASSGNQGGSDANNVWLNPYGGSGASSLVLNGGVFSTARQIRDGAGGGSVVAFNGGTLQAAASIDLLPGIGAVGGQYIRTISIHSGGAVIDSGTFSATISNVLAAGTGSPAGGLTKVGSGTLTLSAANTYSGTTRISAGVLSITNASGMQNSTLDMNALDSGTATFGQNSTLGGLTGSRNLDMGTRTLSVGNNNANTTFSGALSNGGLTKIGAGTLTLSASNSYTGGSTLTQGTLAFVSGGLGASGNVTMNGGTLQWASGNTQDVSSRIVMVNSTTATLDTNTNNITLATGFGSSSSGLVRKTGAGTLTLTGAGSWTGATEVVSGSLVLQRAGSTSQFATSGITVRNGATLGFGTFDNFGTATTTSTPTITINTGGKVTSAPGNTLTTILAMTFNGGTLECAGGDANWGAFNLGAVTVTGTSASAITTTGASNSWFNLRNAGTTFDVADVTGNADSDLVVSAPIRNGLGSVWTVSSLVKAGAGTLTLSATNTYTGATTVSAGVLQLGVANALANTSSLAVNGGGFNLNGNNQTVAAMTLSSGSIFGSGKLTAATYGLTGGTVTGNLGSGTVTVTGNSALNGTSDATTVNINSGSLTLGGGSRFTSPSVAVSGSAGARIVLGGNEAFGSLAGAANVALGSGALSVGAAGTSTAYSGVLSGAGSLTKTGNGKLELTAAQLHTGNTVITGGTLALSGPGSLAASGFIQAGTAASPGGVLDVTALTGGLQVANGQKLGGYGTVLGNVTIAGGATVAPGGSIGALTNTGTQTWADGGSYLFEITNAGGTSPGTSWDLLTVNALSITATAGQFAIDLQTLTNGSDQVAGAMGAGNWDQNSDYQWKFLVANATTFSSANFDSSWFTVNPGNFLNTIAPNGMFQVARGGSGGGLGGSTNPNELYVVYIAVPEPGTLVLAGIGLAVFAWRLRRRLGA